MIGFSRLVRNRIFIGLFTFLFVILSMMQYHDVRIKRDQCKEQQLLTNKKYEQMKLNLNHQSLRKNEFKERSVQVQETLAKFDSLSQHYKLLKNEYEDHKEECVRKISELQNQVKNLHQSNDNERMDIEPTFPKSYDHKIAKNVKPQMTNNFNAQVEISENLYTVIIKDNKSAIESSSQNYINNSNEVEKVFPNGVVPFESKIDEVESKKTYLQNENGDNDVGAGEEENDIDYDQHSVKREKQKNKSKKATFQKTNVELNGYKLKSEVNEDQGKAYQEEMNFQVEDEDDDEYLDHFGRKQG